MSDATDEAEDQSTSDATDEADYGDPDAAERSRGLARGLFILTAVSTVLFVGGVIAVLVLS